MESVYQNSPYSAGARFEFGKNWTRFLRHIDASRVELAKESLLEKLKVPSLNDLTFLDIGCGSGLFSLAARQLGAKVTSFDFDPHSVSCTQELRRRFCPDDPSWRVEQGSVLDREYIESLDPVDIVYSWGVLHHTGAMWEALENAGSLVKPGGKLFVAIYNDAGGSTRRWTAVKRAYVKGPRLFRPVILAASGAYLLAAKVALRIMHPSLLWKRQARMRGMSVVPDFVDWVGGYPFEFATADQIFDFYRQRNFELIGLTTRRGNTCNEFVFSAKGS